MLAVAAITVLGVVIRWRFLDHPMRYDEAYNYIHYVSKSPGYIASHYMPNNHVLHTLLVHGVSRVLGTEPAVLRIPAFLAGVLLIPATAWLGWVLSRRVGVAVCAALAVCASSALVEYSTNARGYSLLALLATLMVGTTVRLIDDPSRRRRWILLGSLAAAGTYTVPVMVFPFVGLCVLILIVVLTGRSKSARGLALAVASFALWTFALYLPVLTTAGIAGLRSTGEMAYGVLGKQIHSVAEMIGEAWGLWCRDAGVGWSVVFVLGLGSYLTIAPGRTSTRHLTPIAALLVPLVLAAAMRAPLPARAWVFALPMTLVCAVCGLWELGLKMGRVTRRPWTATVPIALCVALGLLPLGTVPFLSRLCAEPGGLVEVEPAIDECHSIGTELCAVVAPYSPATVYYMWQKQIQELATPDAPQTQRVYVVTNAAHPLDNLWNSGVKGYANFAPPRLWRTLPSGSVLVVERLTSEASAR